MVLARPARPPLCIRMRDKESELTKALQLPAQDARIDRDRHRLERLAKCRTCVGVPLGLWSLFWQAGNLVMVVVVVVDHDLLADIDDRDRPPLPIAVHDHRWQPRMRWLEHRGRPEDGVGGRLA